MEEKVIIKSRHFRYEWLLILYLPAVSVLLRQGVSVEDMLSITLFLAIAASVFGIITKDLSLTWELLVQDSDDSMNSPSICSPWYWRKVIVYDDRIEVKFPFHKKWNHQIYWDNVDCYCIERFFTPGKYKDIKWSRIYLLIGDKLWLYVSSDEVSNYNAMLSVLVNDFGIQERPGYIVINKEDLKIVGSGRCIELDDISKEEIEEMKRQRRRRSKPRQLHKVSIATKIIDFFAGYCTRVFIFVVAVCYIVWAKLPSPPQTKTKDTVEIEDETKDTVEIEDDLQFMEDMATMTAYKCWDTAFSLNEKKAYRTAFPYMKHSAELGYAKAQYGVGLMYEQGLGTPLDIIEAARWYNLAAQQEEDRYAKVDAMNRLSHLYARRGEFKKAIAILDTAIAIMPYEACLYDSKGEHLYRSGDIQGAKRMWKEVLKRNPNFLNTHKSDLHRLLYED